MHYYTLVVIYKGHDTDLEKRVKQAVRGLGVRCDGGGYFFMTNESDLVFFGNRPQLPSLKTAIKRIRRWKHVTKVTLEKTVKDW